ncbi:glycosyltransferase family 69 protein [Laccaria bicolor S238N-H82]|uniref:Glycosyltransferase family 69 protein n=1 Tax=Laccaria bicolor (strain S238N-H82 / ATCC MYA-4686) TaxID=486041 RepID=B0E2S3_LACBS|nr:glycosyltransferase family 69 protein [Laccaria bicolor S238N-H82]EDQ98855.1 glycosyltransferase family 69 protein [Laccaria bicolor S238N-H82]|eukprot:XP_001890490.1 glycosyltransferase family 69 protein [Laccaria bicolor S238N-H82]
MCLIIWCWGWDSAGDLEGPDVDTIWERMLTKSMMAGSVVVKHDWGLLCFRCSCVVMPCSLQLRSSLVQQL